MTRLRFTEYLDLDLDDEVWRCNRCGTELTSARNPYKQGCLVYDRDPRDIHPPIIEGDYTFSPDPEWVRILEFYCPGCGAQVETEYLPPGHRSPSTSRSTSTGSSGASPQGEVLVSDGRLVVPSRNGGTP